MLLFVTMEETTPVRLKNSTISKIEEVMKYMKGFDTPADVVEVAMLKLVGDKHD